MRIIGGAARGRRIYLPRGCNIRPTSDRIKETLFNILQSLQGKMFLDMFAGSGNVGFEALSRGAARVVFIEKNAFLASAIRRNTESFGFDKRSETLTMELGRGVQELSARGEKFDILFADPPYQKDLIRGTLRCLEDGRLLLQGSVIVIQHSVRENIHNEEFHLYELADQRKSGDTLLSFLKLAT
jgi:16S rRNA (guanine(966)-N(2))-methyltransferase RsmD